MKDRSRSRERVELEEPGRNTLCQEVQRKEALGRPCGKEKTELQIHPPDFCMVLLSDSQEEGLFGKVLLKRLSILM